MISGPAFWGLINPEWSLCNKGRRQSPVNLEPQRLLFDPNLRPLHIDKHRVCFSYLVKLPHKFNVLLSFLYILYIFTLLQVTGILVNTGHSVIFRIDNNSSQIYDESRLAINLTGGPLSYRYRFHEIHIHYGQHDQFGSEHSVQGYTFPAEVRNNYLFNIFINRVPTILP